MSMETLSPAPQVEVERPVSYDVRDFLTEQGFVIGDWFDGKVSQETRPVSSWGILEPVPAKPRRFLGLKFGESKPRMPFIGVIYLDPSPQQTESREAHWLFDVYGEQNIDRLARVANELSTRFGKKINVALADRSPRVETRWEDYESDF